MRSVRTFLAVLAVAALAACGTDPITAPEVAPAGAPRLNEEDGSTTGIVECLGGELVMRVTEAGAIVFECVLRGQYGSANGGG